MPNTSPPSTTSGNVIAALKEEGLWWQKEIDALLAAKTSIPSIVTEGISSNVDGRGDDSAAQSALNSTLSRLDSSLGLAIAAKARCDAEIIAWTAYDSHTHPYVDNT